MAWQIEEKPLERPVSLPAKQQRVGNTTAEWFESEPGVAVIVTTGGTVDDRWLAECVLREQLAACGVKQAHFTFDPDMDFRKTADWNDIMSKAKRLIQAGNVTLLRNGYNIIVAHVVGDHGEYQTEISRDDPNSRVITQWTCECPWDQFAFQRTRQWKKYEARPCAHVLAAYWKSLGTPLDEQLSEDQAANMGTGQRLPGGQPSGPPPGSTFGPSPMGQQGPTIEQAYQPSLPFQGQPGPEFSGQMPAPPQQGMMPGMVPNPTTMMPSQLPPLMAPPGENQVIPPYPMDPNQLELPVSVPSGRPGPYPANPIQQPGTFSHTKMSDYQGWTNWDTWHTKLLMDNEEKHYRHVQKMMENGRWTHPDHVRDWAIPNVLGPHNAEAIADAQEWNEIPEDERVDHHWEDLNEKNPQAAELVEGLGFGKDVSDSEPTLMDPELVNWHEIWESLQNEHNENAEYEREHQRLQSTGLSPDWLTPGHDEDIQHMREAMYRYHGALPQEEIQAERGPGYHSDDPRSVYRRTVTIPYDEHINSRHFDPESHMTLDTRNLMRNMLNQRQIERLRQENADDPKMQDFHYQEPFSRIPYDDYAEFLWYKRTPVSERDKLTKYDLNDPEQQALLNTDPHWQEFAKNGYQQSLTDYTWQTINDIHSGRATPRQTQEMQQALTQHGYTPEQTQAAMAQRRQWDGENWQKLTPAPAPPQPDPRLDQPGDTTFPSTWLSRVAANINEVDGPSGTYPFGAPTGNILSQAMVYDPDTDTLHIGKHDDVHHRDLYKHVSPTSVNPIPGYISHDRQGYQWYDQPDRRMRPQLHQTIMNYLGYNPIDLDTVEDGIDWDDDMEHTSSEGAYWHVAPSDYRDSIQREGLSPHSYLWNNKNLAHEYGDHYVMDRMIDDDDMNTFLPSGYDIWQVNAKGVNPVSDPEQDAENAWLSHEPVGPEHLSLVHHQPRSHLASGQEFVQGMAARLNEATLGQSEGREGATDAGQWMEIPRNAMVEVRDQDQSTGWVEIVYPLRGGPMTSYHVRCFVEPEKLTALPGRPSPFQNPRR